MQYKKFAKLNLEDDPTFQFSDEHVGPIKPGVHFFRWLGKGNPLNVPIADTLYVGPNNMVKIVFNDSKGTVQQKNARFDQQANRDQFFDLCIGKFVRSSQPLSSIHEPIFTRIVAVMKRPCSNQSRCYTNQNTDILLPVSFHAHLLDIAEGNSSQCVIQKFIKSRGKRPSVFRLFWRTASSEGGTVEGWNITRRDNEFRPPEVILPVHPNGNFKEDSLSGSALEEYQFRKQSTKLIASFLQAGEQYIDFSDSRTSMNRKEDSKPLNPWSSGNNLEGGKQKRTPEEILMARRASMHQAPRETVEASENDVPIQFRKKKNIFDHSKEALNQFFLKGLEKRSPLVGSERSDAIMLSTKIGHPYGESLLNSISFTDGLVNVEKCSKLMITRVSNSVLEVPTQYISDVVHWLESILQNQSNLFVHVSDCVCDFIKDDQDRWYLINVKGFKVTPESKVRIKLWYGLNGKNPSACDGVNLSAKERFLKHEAELGVQCKLCGLYYIENSGIAVQSSVDEVPSVVPAYGYTITASAAAIVASIYRAYNLPCTRFASYLLNNFYNSKIQFRSVKRSLESTNFDEGFQIRNSEFLQKVSNNSDIIICCFNCCTIYERNLSLNKSGDILYQLLGVQQTDEDGSFDAMLSGKAESPPFASGNDLSKEKSPQPKLFRPIFDKFQAYVKEMKQKGVIPSGITRMRDEFCTFQALPRNISHWQFLLMLHCVVLEDKDKVDEVSKAFQNSSQDTIDLCLYYQLGQLEVFVPFSIKESQLRSSTSSTDHFQRTIPVNECRVHHFLANKTELFEILKSKKIDFVMLSHDENRSKLKPKKSFKSASERKQERLTALLQSSTRKSGLGSFESLSRVGSSQNFFFQPTQKEGDFDVQLGEMKSYADGEDLSSGFAKFDALLKFQAVNLGTISIRMSFALNMSEEIPVNLAEVKSFFVERKCLYWPSADYYPTQSPLPITWLSMLVDYESGENKVKHGSGPSMVRHSESPNGNILSKSKSLRAGKGAVDDSQRFFAEESLLVPSERREKKSFHIDPFRSTLGLNERLFDPKFLEHQHIQSLPRKLSKYLVDEKLLFSTLSERKEEEMELMGKSDGRPKALEEKQCAEQIRAFSSLYIQTSNSSKLDFKDMYEEDTEELKRSKDEHTPFMEKNEGFQRLINILNRQFSLEERNYLSFLSEHNWNDRIFYRQMQNNLSGKINNAQFISDDDDGYDEDKTLLKSKFVIQKLLLHLKQLCNLDNGEFDLDGPLSISKSKKSNNRGDSLQFLRKKDVGITAQSLKSEFTPEQKICDERADEEDNDDDEAEESASLNSDMNYISEDAVNSMIETLKYLLVLDFLPDRTKWNTLLALIYEYYHMFEIGHNS